MVQIRTLFLISIFIVASKPFAHCQSVSTFLTGNGLNGPDGFTLDSGQNLYVANWGGGSGTTVLRITPGAAVTTADSTSDAPDGLVFDTEGNLYISNYNSGIIHKVTTAGVKTVFASGFNSPSALAFDSEGNLYVSNFTGGKVSRITPDGDVSTYATGFSGPLGLVFDPDGNLFVSNYNNGKVHKVELDGTTTVFATVPNGTTSKIQYLARGSSGTLYLPSYGHHKIYKISEAGEVTVFAGTGVPGFKDGPADSAQFNGPNSIAINNLGEILVSEYNANRIRKITGGEFPSGMLQEPFPGEEPVDLKIYPNPVSGVATMIINRMVSDNPEIELIGNSGKTTRRIHPERIGTKGCEFTFDTSALSPGIYRCNLILDKRILGSAGLIRMQ